MKNTEDRHIEDNRRPEEIEHDIERTRARLSSNIDAIQRKLTPGEMMDEAISYARTSLPADFGSNLNKAVRDNPIPVALIGLGVAWLAMQGKQRPAYMSHERHGSFGFSGDTHRPGSGFASEHGLGFGGQGDVDDHGVGGHITGDHSSSFDGAKNKVSAAGSSLKDKASSMAQNVKSKFSGGSQDSSQGYSSSGPGIKEKISSAGQSIREKASELGSRVSGSGSNMGDRSRGMAQDARSRANDLGQRSQQQYYRAKDSVTHMVEEQPMFLGVLGLALGTIIAAIIPPTRREDELLGHTRDDFFARGQQMAREQAENLKSSAQHVAETVKETVKDEAQRMGGDSSGRGRDADSYKREDNTNGPNLGSQSLH